MLHGLQSLNFGPTLLRALLVLCICCVVACQEQPIAATPDASNNAAASVNSQTPVISARDPDVLTRATQEQAQRIAAASASASGGGVDRPRVQANAPTVHWIDANSDTPRKPVIIPAPAPSNTALTPLDAATQPANFTNPRTNFNTSSMSRNELIQKLCASLRTGNDPVMERAMSAAVLSILSESKQMDPVDLQGLDPQRKELVLHYHQLLTLLDAQVRSGKPIRDRDPLITAIEQLTASRPLSIRTLKLCRRVQSFGLYDEIVGSAFLAGRENPMVVYVEIDQFRSTNTDAGRFQVRIAQELELYNDADGLIVWKQPKVEIVDESANQRRDFFVVQLIRLPARLTVGKYRLKVRVTDLATQSFDESQIPVQIVADPSLVGAAAIK